MATEFSDEKQFGNETSPQTGGSANLRYATLSQRFIAMIIDNLFLGALFVVFVILPEAIAGIYLLLWVVFVLFYVLILEGIRTNQTVGKYVMGLKVAKDDGSQADVPSSLLRNGVGIIGQIVGLFGLLVGAFAINQSKENKRLGDSVANTIVTKK